MVKATRYSAKAEGPHINLNKKKLPLHRGAQREVQRLTRSVCAHFFGTKALMGQESKPRHC